MVAVAPGQIICKGVMFKTGGATTLMFTVSFAIQPNALLTVKIICGLVGIKPKVCVVFCIADVKPSPKFQR